MLNIKYGLLRGMRCDKSCINLKIMKINDKNIKRPVDVLDKNCPKKPCYWPRKDPGSFSQGVGYKSRSNDWICGTREISGCPINQC